MKKKLIWLAVAAGALLGALRSGDDEQQQEWVEDALWRAEPETYPFDPSFDDGPSNRVLSWDVKLTNPL